MFKTRNLTKRILLNYAFTFMLVNLADSASMVIDGLIISRNLNSTMLAAAGLGGTSYQMILLFCGAFATGLQATCSGAMGSGDSEKTNRYFTSGLVAVSSIAVILTVFGFICLDPLCRLFGADGSDKQLYDGLHEYMRGWFVGIPGLIAFTVLCPLATLDGGKKTVAFVTLLQSALNICGDYFSVIHWQGDSLRAIYGVGFSSGAAFDIAAVILLADFFRRRSAFKLDMKLFRLREIKNMMYIGMPRLTKYACKLLSPLLVYRTVIDIGGACAMAVMSVKSSITGFCLVAGSGIAVSVNLLSQVYFSEKDKKALKEVAVDAAAAVIAICSVIAVLLIAFAPLLSDVFLDRGTEEYRLCVIMMHCFAISLPLNCLNACVLSYLQGIRRILPTHLQTVSNRLFFLAVCTAVFGYSFGTVGIFAAIPVSELLVLLTYIAVALLFGRNRNRLDALLLIPENFDLNDDKSLAFTVTAPEEVTGISEQIQNFCLSHGIDRRRAYFSALCVEETAGNVVNHGFKMDNKKHSCDIRVMIEDGGNITLRIRDDCRYFNMKERYEVMKSKDEFSGIGIKLVYGIAKDVSYVNLLNTNTLIIRV